MTNKQFPVLYTGGTFDLFHAGHVNFLRMCRKIVGKDGWVIVSLNTDDFVKRTKGVTTLPYKDRYQVVSSCRYVDMVVCNTGGEDSKPAILEAGAAVGGVDFIAIGTDWACKDYYAQMMFTPEWLNAQGTILIYLPYDPHISSSTIRRNLRNTSETAQ